MELSCVHAQFAGLCSPHILPAMKTPGNSLRTLSSTVSLWSFAFGST